MAFPHPGNMRFTIRGLMIAVAAIAGLLALLRTWPVLLLLAFVVLLANLMAALVALYVACTRAPGWTVPWRAGIIAGLQGAGILAAGWVWCLSAVHFLQPSDTLRWTEPTEFWGWKVPMAGTGLGLTAFVSRLVVICIKRRRPDLGAVVATYTWAMATAWLVTFLCLAPLY